MSLLCDLQINLNHELTFFLNQDLISEYSGFLRKIIKQSKKKKKNHKNSRIIIEVEDFPGGSDGFELVSRFCYSNGGGISIDVSNVSILYCSSSFLEMTEKLCSSNLLLQTEKFLEGVFYWSWNDVLLCLKSCEQVFLHADSYGLVDKLVFGVLAKIAQNSDMSHVFASSSPSSSASASSHSPDTAKTRSDSDKRSTSRSFSCKTSNEWWFDDMSILGPRIIEKLIKNLGAYNKKNNSLVLTRFLLHYLKTKLQNKSNNKHEYSGLADTAVQGVVFAAKTAFSCRKIFWVLRVLSGFNISNESRIGLESVIGEMLDQATLDDLLIPAGGKREKGFYDVDLVIRLVKVFVRIGNSEEDENLRMTRIVGKLIDKYLREISPDQNLKVSKFLEVAESLPDSARDWFDGLYRAIDIYLESHLKLSSEDRTKICRCLNYKKLTLETCKQLAKNPKIPPNIAVLALKSQQLSDETPTLSSEDKSKVNKIRNSRNYLEEKPILVRLKGFDISSEKFEDDLRMMNLERKLWNSPEIVCKEKKSEVVSRLVRHGHTHSSSNFPRLC
ncbi:PREDICTED: BTB/POZ domain-containing protein At3g19850-like [Camelina sativa]|uniref:BTB/POZ domain-containing protein At3g19850-like n=1 Tax=Camelina sativa TaxID=90675 RepID=A0ABM0YZ04_CAMSA|nr:PREDICTED: BTB/POZ domain-containing protein At3g19850-like [Camelina sativa]